MRIAYTFDFNDPATGWLFFQADVELEVSVEWDGSEPRVTIDAVYASCSEPWNVRRARKSEDGKIPPAREITVDMMAAGGAWKALALEIMDAAEDDQWVIDQAFREEGIVYVGRGGNDPDGHFKIAEWAR